MQLNFVCIPGDGIGPEIINEARKVVCRCAELYGHQVRTEEILMGGASIDAYGIPLTEEAVQTAKAADAVLMGAVGGDSTTSPWYRLPPNKRPEAGLLQLRRRLGVFANLRPAYL
ncbi:MAG: 3-isopropylmalate dehydrogenase, partial [Lachnospiraceae bacterium]|nr:3-isopropylmalate dehydrogenase [Lachnospiraceae bacterium]